MNLPIRILGIDPGLRKTGWGIIEQTGNRLAFIAAGTVRAPQQGALADRLAALHEGLVCVVQEWRPQLAAIEETFVNKDARATLKLGHARGVAMLVPAQAGIMVAEYAPNVVKKAVVGAGHADKIQVQAMVKILLPKAQYDSDDAADALAIAICHAHHSRGIGMREHAIS